MSFKNPIKNKTVREIVAISVSIVTPPSAPLLPSPSTHTLLAHIRLLLSLRIERHPRQAQRAPVQLRRLSVTRPRRPLPAAAQRQSGQNAHSASTIHANSSLPHITRLGPTSLSGRGRLAASVGRARAQQ